MKKINTQYYYFKINSIVDTLINKILEILKEWRQKTGNNKIWFNSDTPNGYCGITIKDGEVKLIRWISKFNKEDYHSLCYENWEDIIKIANLINKRIEQNEKSGSF